MKGTKFSVLLAILLSFGIMTTNTFAVSRGVTKQDIETAIAGAESAISASDATLFAQTDYLAGWVADAKKVAEDVDYYDQIYLQSLLNTLNEGAKALGYLTSAKKYTSVAKTAQAVVPAAILVTAPVAGTAEAASVDAASELAVPQTSTPNNTLALGLVATAATALILIAVALMAYRRG